MADTKKTGRVIINGDFLCNTITGIERLAMEITKELDKICKKNEIGIVIPRNAKTDLDLNVITVYPYNKDIRSFPKWQQFGLPRITKKYNAIPLDFGNSCSFFNPGITFLHDIYCRIYPEDFTGRRERLECFYFRFLYRIIALRAKKIITVSNYCRDQIQSIYHVKAERIQVIHSSYDHFKQIKSDYSIFNEFPQLMNKVMNKGYYFSLGSLSKRKNIRWIIEYALKHPEALFAISGKSLPTVKVEELNTESPKNIILLGYLDDSKVKALMERCRAFILPSYYEGFGLTPLEALSCGAKVIVSNAASLPEIYGGAAYYIDPFNTDTDLDELIKGPVENPDSILETYSYKKSAEALYKVIKEVLS
jgi:glycosyltransferase involved in cell wall biosynthesis